LGRKDTEEAEEEENEKEVGGGCEKVEGNDGDKFGDALSPTSSDGECLYACRGDTPHVDDNLEGGGGRVSTDHSDEEAVISGGEEDPVDISNAGNMEVVGGADDGAVDADDSGGKRVGQDERNGTSASKGDDKDRFVTCVAGVNLYLSLAFAT